MFLRGGKGFVRGGDHAHVHVRQIKITAMCALKFGRDIRYVASYAFHFEVVRNIWESFFQALAHAQPGFAVDRFGDGSAEFEISAKQGFCLLEITLLDSVHEGLNSCFWIHYHFPLRIKLIEREYLGLG